MDMPKYAGPEDIYRETVEQPQQGWLVGLLAFAVVEERRIEWVRHRRRTVDAAPTSEEVQAWYEAQPHGAVVRAVAHAESALRGYGKQVAEDFDEAHRLQVAEGVVVAEIRRLGRWAPVLGMNVLGGLIGSTLFTALLILLGTLVLNEPSASELAGRLKDHMENGYVEEGNND
jgi:hypothetical protein